MENPSTQFLSNIENYLKVAAHCAMAIVVTVSLRLCLTIYYVYHYFSSLRAETNVGIHAYSYLGNSIMDFILSSLSIYFLYRFAQYTYQFCRDNDSLTMEGVFTHFRNYLIMAIILGLNWIFFEIANLLFGVMSW